MKRAEYATLRAGELRWRCDAALIESLRAGAPAEVAAEAPAEAPAEAASPPRKRVRPPRGARVIERPGRPPALSGELITPPHTLDPLTADSLYFTQGRALESLQLGVRMEGPGYHIFVAGPSSTGKTSTVKAMLRDIKRPQRALKDFLYVNNFEDGDRPHLIALPAGEGRELKRAVARFVELLPEVVHGALSSERVERARRQLEEQLVMNREDDLEALQAECAAAHFTLVKSGEDMSNVEVAVVVGRRRKPVHIDEWILEVERGKIKAADVDATIATHEALELKLHQVWERAQATRWEAKRKLSEVEVAETRHALRYAAQSLAPFYVKGERASVLYAWVEGLAQWIEDHLEELKEYKSSKEEPLDLRDVRVLQVNLIHEAAAEPPVIFEQSPTLINLLGTIERSGDDTHPHLDYGDIRGGSLLKANGGILVVNANDMATDAPLWRSLLRALRSRSLEIQSPDQLFASGGCPLKPTPIPLDIKVLAIGDDELYRALFVSNDDFGRVFKIKVEFDDALPNAPESVGLYVSHADKVAREEGLPRFTHEALSLWVEFGTRLSGRQDRLSTQLGTLTDVLREAAFYAKEGEAEAVSASHMRRALQQRFERHQLIEDHLFKMFDDQVIELSPSGWEVGAANGLTVLDFGDHACGHPCRISASVSPGEAGVVSVEREVELSGRLHDKGALTLSAYLRARYLPDAVCALHATLIFDQLHDEVEGDSASLAEAVALISALSGAYVDQGVAMTGALDSRGRVQAIGGVNEKVEGFFRLCKLKGLTGEQGVVIPSANVRDLALRQEVIDAVEAGRFRLWPVSTVDEALEVICDRPAGEPPRAPSLRLPRPPQGEDGAPRGAWEDATLTAPAFPVGSINDACRARLLALSSVAASFNGGAR